MNKFTEEQNDPMWYFFALLGPMIWALTNHLDKYLLDRSFKNNPAGPVLVVFTGFAGFFLSIAILLFGPSVFTLPPWQAFLMISAGVLLVASYIPYMIAMQINEASTIASLYRLGPLFVLGLSYLALGERLHPQQMVGGIVTIAGSILLIINPDKARRGLNLSVLLLMCAACFMNACTIVIFKLVALNASLLSPAFWQYIGIVLFSIALICGLPPYRRALFAVLRSREAYFLVPITLLGEALNLLANLAVGFAGLMAPLALVSIVTGLHPFFLLLYGILFTWLLPTFCKEQVTARHISQKFVAIGIMCAGMVVTFAK